MTCRPRRWPRAGVIAVTALVMLTFGCGPDETPSGGLAPAVQIPVTPSSLVTTLLTEGFDDGNTSARGWYDNKSPAISTVEHHTGAGSLQMAWAQGASTPVKGGAFRHKFPASDRVYVRYWVKYSANYVGSGQDYHPHEFHLITNEDGDFVGPSTTHLTMYIEQNYKNGGRPQLSITDVANIDVSRLNVDLTNVTEARASAGCNGSADGYPGDCYQLGSEWRNEKIWRASQPSFLPNPGPGYKNNWNQVEVYYQLNSIVNGKGQKDGVAQYWFNGQLIIDRHNIVFRTGVHPTMQFTQFLMAPYIGSGSPVAQTMWVDDLLLATGRDGGPPPPPTVTRLTLTPASVTLNQGITQQFSAVVSLSDGTTQTSGVSWNATGGTVTASGLYTSGTAAGTFRIIATSSAGPADTSAVTVTSTPPLWPHEPTNLPLLNEYGFNDPVPASSASATVGGGWSVGSNSAGNGTRQINALGTPGPYSPGSLYQVRYPIGFTGGSAPSTLISTAAAGKREVYIAFWWRPSSPWQSEPTGLNAIITQKFTSSSGARAYLSMAGSGATHFIRCRTEGSASATYDDASQTNITLGQWHLVEWRMAYPGTIQVWVDGVLRIDATAAASQQFGGTSFAATRILPTWGTTGSSKTEVDYMWFDHIKIRGL